MSADSTQFPIDQAVQRLHEDLAHRALNKVWAKLEILLGLAAVSGATLMGVWAVTRLPEPNLEFSVIAIVLFSLGGYLALAGNRSHLYQSNNRLVAYLAELIRRSTPKD